MSARNNLEPLKIVYSKSDEEFQVVKGVVDLGYMGIYDTDSIEIDFDEDILESVFDNDGDKYDLDYYEPLKPYLRSEMTNDEIAKGLSDYYNMRIADINKHQTELNQLFLSYLLEGMMNCGYELWEECTDYLIEEEMPDCDEDDLYDVIYSDEACDAISKLVDDFSKKEHTGEPSKDTPAEDIFRKYFPMFNLKKFLSEIDGEYLHLSNAVLTFQCSGVGDGANIACGAYAEITVNNMFEDWHNF